MIVKGVLWEAGYSFLLSWKPLDLKCKLACLIWYLTIKPPLGIIYYGLFLLLNERWQGWPVIVLLSSLIVLFTGTQKLTKNNQMIKSFIEDSKKYICLKSAVIGTLESSI